MMIAVALAVACPRAPTPGGTLPGCRCADDIIAATAALTSRLLRNAVFVGSPMIMPLVLLAALLWLFAPPYVQQRLACTDVSTRKMPPHHPLVDGIHLHTTRSWVGA
jgi:hypothetical protein